MYIDINRKQWNEHYNPHLYKRFCEISHNRGLIRQMILETILLNRAAKKKWISVEPSNTFYINASYYEGKWNGDFRPRVEKGNATKVATARASLRSMFTIYRRIASHVDMKNTPI